MNVTFTKVTESDPEVVSLATAMGESPRKVAGMINGDRYRKAYNRVKAERDRAMRAWFKGHPEMMPKEGR